MPRTVDPQLREARRGEILRAAARCFARRGFHRTTMREVYRAAGLSAGAVYHYFSSKQAIIEAIAAREREEDALLLSRLRAAPDPGSGLARCLQEIIGGARDRDVAAMGVELSAEALRNPRVRRVFDRNRTETRSALLRMLKAAANAGTIDRSLHLPTTADVILMVAEAAYYHAALESAEPPAILARTLGEMLRRLLAPQASRGQIRSISTSRE